MEHIEIKITPHRAVNHYVLTETVENEHGRELSKEERIIHLPPQAFASEQSVRYQLYQILLAQASKTYSSPHTLRLSIFE